MEDIILSALNIGITIADFSEFDIGMITDLLAHHQNTMPKDADSVYEASDYEIANF